MSKAAAKNFRVFFVILAILVGTEAFSINAAPGDLDPTFGAGGKVTTAVGVEDRASASVLQADGKIVVGGRSRPGAGSYDFALARYNPDGSLDATFGSGGRVLTSLNRANAPDDEIHALSIQPDGKIVAVGTVKSSGGGLEATGIVRYHPNGTLDTSFGVGGILFVDAGVVFTVIIQPDGKIVCGGGGGDSSLADFEIARINPNGTLDTTFGSGGLAIIDFNNSGDGVFGLALQPDGKIVAAGRSRGSGGIDNFAAARLNPNGSLDTSFGTGGRVRTDFFGDEDFGYAVVLQPDGKIVLAGQARTPPNNFNFGLLRYNSNGTLDTTFGTGGKAVVDFDGTSEAAYAVKLQQNGKIVVAGLQGGISTGFGVARLQSNGSLDAAFGSGGKVTTFFDGRDVARSLLIQADGKIVAAGTARGGGNIGKFALARYLGDPVASRNRFADFDGDGKADVSVFRPSNGVWYLSQSTNGFTGVQFGLSSDKLTPADYDGDGKTDIAVYRGGTWYLQRSQAGFTGIAFGASDDIPVPADYDGDGKSEIAVFRPSNGVWYFYNLATNQTSAVAFGQADDKPVAADYDGDAKADVAVFRNGTWYLLQSALGFTGVQFGEATDKPVAADYDGDGKADIAVFRPSNGVWYLQRSNLGFTGIAFGLGTDTPTPADYDGDGKTDVAVFRNGIWYVQQSQAGFTSVSFGAATDVPVIAVSRD